ncbi:MAG: alpha/beta fold hydrolase [Alphaproteobacteria bacterium]|nr:alpha/beta fold hydrolase [Alphaproteobacteria bacterium]
MKEIKVTSGQPSKPAKLASVSCAWSQAGSGEPLLLIHGIGAARNAWAKLMPILTPRFTVITYDLRGHGASPAGDGVFDLDHLVLDLEAVRVAAGINAMHIAGHSLGGMIGPAYARAYPERVLSLGLLSTAAFRTQQDSQNVWAVVKAMEEKGIPQVLETLSDRWFTDAFIKAHSDVVNARLKQVIATDPDIFLNVFRIYAGTEMAPWLAEIAVPSLVLTGEKDGGCNPRLNQQIATAMPHSELVILPELKHSLLLEAGDTVADHIIQFIDHL